jgi:O-antigen/teichoic acid export membrane protein
MTAEVTGQAPIDTPQRPRWLRAMLTLSDQAIVSATTFGTVWLFNYWLGPDISKAEQGLYALIYASVWVFAREVLQSLVSTPHTIQIPTWQGSDRNRLNGSALLHHFGLSAVIMLGLATTSALAGSMGNAKYSQLFFAATLATPPLLMWNFLRMWCFSLRKIEVAWVLDASVSLLSFAGIAALHFWGHLSAPTLVAAIGLANLLPSLGVLIYARKDFAINLKDAGEDARTNWITGRWLLGSSMIWASGLYLYPWLITALRSEADTGIYSYCFMLAGLANPLLFAVQNWLGPHIAHAFADRPLSDFRRYVFRSAWGFGLFMAPMSVLMAVFAHPILNLIAPQYAAHSATVSMLSLAMIPQAMSFSISRGLFSMGRTSIDLAANVVPIVVFAAVGVVLVRYYGPEGAAGSMLLAQLCGVTFRMIAFARIHRSDLPIDETTGIAVQTSST